MTIKEIIVRIAKALKGRPTLLDADCIFDKAMAKYKDVKEYNEGEINRLTKEIASKYREKSACESLVTRSNRRIEKLAEFLDD